MLNKIYFSILLLALPAFASAQVYFSKTGGMLDEIKYIVSDILIPLVFTLALLFFFGGVAKYIWSEGQGKAEGKQIMIWGVIALTVMTSIWGLVYFISTEFGLNNGTTSPIPTIGGTSV